MNNEDDKLEIGKPMLYEGQPITLSVNKDKSLSFTDETKKVDKDELSNFLKRLSDINNNTIKVPLVWDEVWIRILLNIFAGLATFTMLNYLVYLVDGVHLNHLGFVFSLTWIIFTLIPITVVIAHIFSSKSMSHAKMKFLRATLPGNMELIYFVTAFYNGLNKINYFNKKDQALRNAHVITKDIFDVDGLKMLEKDIRSWLKLSGIGVKDK